MYRRSASVPSCAAQIWSISFSFASSASIGSMSMMLSVILFAIDCCIYRTIGFGKTYKQNAKIDLYGPLGDLIISGENIKQIDLNAYSNGIYVLYITYNGKTITHKIIKQ